MKLDIRLEQETNKQMELFLSEISTKTDSFMLNLNNYIVRQSAMGLTDEQIVANLEAQLTGEVGVFSAFKNDIGRVFSSSVVQASRGFFNLNITDKKGAQDIREWVTVYSGNPSTKHCDECLARHEKALPMEQWEELGTPDNPFFDVHIAYGVPCHCILLPREMFTEDLKEPIEI